MSAIIDMTGRRFGRLAVISFAHAEPPRRQAHWHVVCDCGTRLVVSGAHLRSDHSRSCGCLSHDAGAERLIKHGDYGSVEYFTWRRIIRRCCNVMAREYPNYGGRGIRVCERWRNSFETFLADMGRRPKHCNSIDRIDNDGNYEPGNCRWATQKEQSRNQRTNKLLTFSGETMPESAWAERLGIGASTLRMRLRRGWSVARALSQSIGPNGGNHVRR